ncbi:FAD/NAD(P)-binding domain-containing protein [Pyrenochaeta sp. DS3sAY3a]|nr:FAD/NAD(P)-binding domain-containing protein [Pyrenochaeta sp. DS3sAY3a]
MASEQIKDIAIIGGGFSGLVVALALKAQGYSPVVYELREPGHQRLAGGVVLTANGQSALDKIGALACVKDKGYSFEALYYMNEEDEIVATTDMDGSKYQYTSTRILRGVCIEEWASLLNTQNVLIQYNARYDGVVSEREDGVTFKINGVEKTASLLIGADGIHSSVRKFVCPSSSLEYQGLLGVMSHISVDQIRFPSKDYPHVATVMAPTGGFMVIPETPDESIVLAARQVVYPEQDREGWRRVLEDHDKLFELLKTGYETSHDILKSFVDAADKARDKLFIWPFYKAKVSDWTSSTGRVILIGDAAHALPPSSGQGVNQALEDSYVLARVLGKVGPTRKLKPELMRWQNYRMARVDKILEWVSFMESTTAADKHVETYGYKLGARATKESLKEKSQSFGWIFSPPFGEDFEQWVEGA